MVDITLRSPLNWLRRSLGRSPLLRYMRHRVQAVPAARATPDRPAAAGASDETRMRVHTCALFYSYFRFHATIETAKVFGAAAIPVAATATATARLLLDEAEPAQKSECRRQAGGLLHEVFVEALVDPARFPGNGYIQLRLGDFVSHLTVEWLLLNATHDNFKSLFNPFKQHITDWVAAHAPARPKLLDIGGRARSGNNYNEHVPECDYTTFDIVADEGVHVVGDAHQLSRHFPPEHFDFVWSVSVFEHLVMPWKAVIELNRVLKPGGIAYIFSHQTIGMHDMPWDFFRFSDSAWSGLFNRYTGFEIIETEMSLPAHIITRSWMEHHRGNEEANGFESSSVLVRKIGPTSLAWEVDVPAILSTHYPRH